MEAKKDNILRRFTDKLFGGLNMSWPVVILFAVATAVVTSVFLIVPVFSNTSFVNMGTTFEAWIFFAIIIMSNCKKPLESAFKTFVFFLISQPLIYLIQVPFSEMGWQLFMYYKYWFIWTLLTFPMALAGWYIKKKNWLSLLILSPILVYLAFTSANSFIFTFKHFPYQLVTAIFCLLQVLLYLYAFTSNIAQKLLGFFVPLAIVIIIAVLTPQVDMSASVFLPDEPKLSQSAVAASDDESIAQISVTESGKDGIVTVKAQKYGETDFTITYGDKEYRYHLKVYEDDGGHAQTEITEIK